MILDRQLELMKHNAFIGMNGFIYFYFNSTVFSLLLILANLILLTLEFKKGGIDSQSSSAFLFILCTSLGVGWAFDYYGGNGILRIASFVVIPATLYAIITINLLFRHKP